MRLRRFVRLLTIAIVLQAAFGLARAQLRRAHVDERAVATLEDLSEIYLEVQAGPQDNYVAMALRYAGSELSWAAIENANGRRPVVEGRFYGIPFDILSADWRARAIQALFPQDGPGEEGWVHRVPDSDDGQPLQKVAIWFTGDVALADDLAETNGIDDWSLPAGREVVIPAAVLLPRFLAAVDLSEPPAEPAGPPGATRDEKGRPAPGEEPAPPRRRPPAAPVRVGDLTFHDDPERPYAVYHLKAGEALYSSVVVRFTGRLDPEEVNQVAGSIAQLSGISRPTSIPIGFPVRIPRDLVLPEYLPPDDPQRIAYEADLAAAGRHRITVEAKDLHGVILILDAGHGGDDVGARRNGVHEDDYVYDILCRIKEVAERTTGARVFATIKDRSSAYKPLDGPFRIDRDEMILTTPAYHPRQPHVSTAGVN
ncbi:MAG TPA: hypothetical protein VFP98_10705, partial [Candidatus Polarisedimenticolia bacterium]|nr:hypothetical protein [Candidatus Polarisedimenticolia bacterium]